MSDYISGDTLALIFKRLPTKSLLRFRSVCKRWKEFIDSPFFIKEHLSFQKPCFLLQNEGSPLKDCFVVDPHTLPSFNFLDSPIEDEKLMFCGTHHGLVCLFYKSEHSKIPNKLLIWNPSIRKLLAVLIPDFQECLFEYEEGLNWFGFWIDPCTKEYKFIVLCLVLEEEEYLEYGDHREIVGVDGMMYSSLRRESRDWRFIDTLEEEIGNVVLCPPVMIQGVAHWMGNRYEDGARIILSFDFVLEEFDTIHMPDHLQYASSQPIHCHWQGNLSLVVRDLKSSDNYNVYVRQEEEWLNMFSFNVLPNSMDKVLWVLGEEERIRVLAGNHGQLVLCDNRDGIIPFTNEDYDDDDDDDDDGVCFDDNVLVAYDFVESLLFP